MDAAVDSAYRHNVLFSSLSEHGNADAFSKDISKALQGLVKVYAYRDISTEAGFVAKGSIGFVTKEWINRAVTGGCSCKGSPNWFRII